MSNPASFSSLVSESLLDLSGITTAPSSSGSYRTVICLVNLMDPNSYVLSFFLLVFFFFCFEEPASYSPFFLFFFSTCQILTNHEGTVQVVPQSRVDRANTVLVGSLFSTNLTDSVYRVVAGQSLSFTIFVHDSYFNRRDSPSLVRAFAISATNAIAVDIVASDVGAYNASFEPTIAGDYLLTVVVDRQDIPHSPFRFQVMPSIADSKAITVSGMASSVGFNNPFEFFFETRDRFGNVVVLVCDCFVLSALFLLIFRFLSFCFCFCFCFLILILILTVHCSQPFFTICPTGSLLPSTFFVPSSLCANLGFRFVCFLLLFSQTRLCRMLLVFLPMWFRSYCVRILVITPIAFPG
jgi:hypothetical protein